MSKVSRFGFAVQADIVVNINPDQPATLFCSSDGLTRQQVIDQLKIEHGDGVLKQDRLRCPLIPLSFPPARTLSSDASAKVRNFRSLPRSFVLCCICQGQVEVYSGNKEPERPYIRPGAVFGTDCLQLFLFNLKLRLGRQRQL
jgi:hypothetical protein